MAGIQRSAGAVSYDVYLGSTAKVIAQARAARVEIDKALNEGGNNVNVSASNGQSAGDAYAKGFTSKTSGVTDGIKKSLKDAEKTSGNSGDTSGSSWRSSFDKHISDMKSAFTSSFKNIEADAGGSGGRSGDNWGSKFFGSASGWFKKLQDAETGILGTLGAGLPLGIAGGAGVLAGVGSIASSVAAPAVGLAAGGGLLASLVSGASTNLTNVAGAGGNQAALSAAVNSAAAGMTTAQAKTELDAIGKLSSGMQGFIGTLGQANTSYLTLSTAQQSDLAHLNAGTAAYKALNPAQQAVVKSLQAQAQAFSGLSPMQQGFALSLNTLKTALTNVQNNASTTYLKTFQNLVKAATEVMAKFQPILNSTGASFEKLSGSILKGVGGSAFKDFLDKINTSIQGGAITKLADGIGNIAAALGILWTKDSGAGSLLTHLDNIGTEFKNWAASQGSDGSFTKFLDYLKTNGDHLGQIIKDLAESFAKIAPSLAGFGTGELNIVTGFFNLIEKLPPSLASHIVEVVSALMLLQKLNAFGAVSSVFKFFNSDTAASIGKVASAMAGAAVAAVKWVAEMVVAAVTMDTDTIALKLMYLWDGLVAASEAVAAMASRLLALAMDAIPIVLIVVALIALVAAIIYYHKQIIDFVIKVWNEIWAFLKQWWYVIILAVFTGGLGLIAGLVIKYHTQIFDFIVKIWNDITGFFISVWGHVENVAEGAWNSVYKSVTGAATDIWHDTVKILGHMTDDIKGVFQTIANDGFVTPLNKIIYYSLGGIVNAVDDIAGVVGLKNLIPHVSQNLIPAVHLAEGGIVKGGVPGKDSVPAMLMPDEVVLSTSQVAKLGGHQAIANMVGGAHPQNVGGVIHAGWGWNPISDAKQAASDVGSGASKAANWAKGLVLGGVADALGAVINPLVSLMPATPALADMLKGAAQTVVGDVLTWVRGKDKAANQSTAGVNLPGNALSWITQGMAAAGRGTDPTWLKGLEIIAQGESGGNQSSVNTTDSNAQAGHPSAGLMQFIQSTFSSYAKPGYTTWMNPVDQVVADAWSGGYIQQRYGGIDNVPGVKSVLGGGAYVGYDSGGWLEPGVTATYNGIGTPEAILTPSQWNTMESLASRGAAAPVVYVYVTLDGDDVGSKVVTRVANELGDALAGGMVTT